MPSTFQSPYETNRTATRVQQQDSAQTARVVKSFRAKVEKVIEDEERAGQLETDVNRFNTDEAFRQQVASESAASKAWKIFIGGAVIVGAVEFFASSEVAAWLASQMAPLFSIQTQEPPAWLRQTVGVGFVLTMLTPTLLLKFVTGWYLAKFKEARTTAQVGEDGFFRRMTIGIWANHAAKALYLALVAGLYVWLFSFAQERADKLAAMDAMDQEETAPVFTFSGSAVKAAEEAKPAEGDNPASGVQSKLAKGTAVVYVALWVMHALLLVWPTDGFGRELEYAGFRRGSAMRTAREIRLQQGRTARDILTQIYSVDGAQRDALLREAQPAAKIINRIASWEAMDVPGQQDGDAPSAGTVKPNPPISPAPAGSAATPEAVDAYDAIFGTKTA